MERIKYSNNGSAEINADGLFYKDMNKLLRDTVLAHNLDKIKLTNVYGQRYIGTSIGQPIKIEVEGTPGNDLGAFMNGPTIEIFGNAQDGCGNTMNAGEIIIHGNAGDILGISARGGEIYVKGNVGYRVGIHMKEYKEKKPVLVIGGTAQDFLGEYMAGGILILLGLNLKETDKHKATFIGTGMHNGIMYLSGNFDKRQLGKEVGQVDLNDDDKQTLEKHIGKFAKYFGYNAEKLLARTFAKIVPTSLRPYGKLYAY
jgi:glutamate synthase domain-containing protein 3